LKTNCVGCSDFSKVCKKINQGSTETAFYNVQLQLTNDFIDAKRATKTGESNKTKPPIVPAKKQR